MKILLISPLGFPINPSTKYAGIERLVWEYSKELSKEHDVSVFGHAQSIYPEKVKNLSILSSDSFRGEILAYQSYGYLLRTFDVIHDFSHLHLASRFNINLPSLNIFWHAPALARYEKSPYNIIALSQWAAREFKRIYRQEARYQQSIAIDTSLYKPASNRGDRFLTIGRMAPEKGNLASAMLCKKLGESLDIVGGRGAEAIGGTPLTRYEQQIQDICDGKQVRFLGEISEEEKIRVMQSCKALLYCTNHPEVTSHKIQEAMLCGAPVIVPRLGALPEIVNHGIDGFLCADEDEYLEAMKNVHGVKPDYEKLSERYSIENVVKNYIPLYEEVSKGLRW